MSNLAAVYLNGELYVKSSDVAHEVKNTAPTKNEMLETERLDRLIGAIGLVVVEAEAQGLSRKNKVRLGQFLYAAGERVAERTRLNEDDQKEFDAAIRKVSAKING